MVDEGHVPHGGTKTLFDRKDDLHDGGDWRPNLWSADHRCQVTVVAIAHGQRDGVLGKLSLELIERRDFLRVHCRGEQLCGDGAVASKDHVDDKRTCRAGDPRLGSRADREAEERGT